MFQSNAFWQNYGLLSQNIVMPVGDFELPEQYYPNLLFINCVYCCDVIYRVILWGNKNYLCNSFIILSANPDSSKSLLFTYNFVAFKEESFENISLIRSVWQQSSFAHFELVCHFCSEHCFIQFSGFCGNCWTFYHTV